MAIEEDSAEPHDGGANRKDQPDHADNEDGEGLALMASFDSYDEIIGELIEVNALQEYARVFRNAAVLVRNDTSPEDRLELTPAERAALHAETTHKWRQPWPLYLSIIMCSVGAIEQGMAQTSMNGANLYFPKQFGIDSDSAHDTFIVGLINSGIYLSVGLFGAWLSEPINNRLGRRGAVCVGSSVCIVANLASALSQGWRSLLLFRIALGAGLGINTSTINVYAAECAPSYIRGGLAVSWQMFTAFGLLIGFVVNIAVFNTESPWRWQLAFPAIPVIPLALFIWSCPESPAWILKSDQNYASAFQSLRRLRRTDLQGAKEIVVAYQTHRQQSKAHRRSNLLRKFIQLFTIPRIRRATQAAFVVMLAQQLCGSINIIAFFSSTIFLNAGFSVFQALLASILFGFVNVIGAIPAVWTMESLGRRSLLLLTLPPMALTMFIASLTFRLPEHGSARLYSLAAAIYIFCGLYSPGMGPVPAPYSAEVFAISHRELGMSFAVSVANTWAAVLSMTFPRLLSILGSEGAFQLYAFLNVVAFVLVYLFVPETRLKTLEELDKVFSVRTRDRIHYNTMVHTPWLVRRHVLRQKGTEPPELDCEQEYAPLVQDQED